jgi:hypothetical protein
MPSGQSEANVSNQASADNVANAADAANPPR